MITNSTDTIIPKVNALLIIDIQEKIIIIFTKIDKLKNKHDREALKELNNITKFQLNKNFFNTSIKEANTIILLKKFMVDVL